MKSPADISAENRDFKKQTILENISGKIWFWNFWLNLLVFGMRWNFIPNLSQLQQNFRFQKSDKFSFAGGFLWTRGKRLVFESDHSSFKIFLGALLARALWLRGASELFPRVHKKAAENKNYHFTEIGNFEVSWLKFGMKF